MTERTDWPPERYEMQIHYMRKQIAAWAKELTEILEGHFEIPSIENFRTVKLIKAMEAMGEV